MKKGKYIDLTVLMACLSHRPASPNLQGINDLLNKACKKLLEQGQKPDFISSKRMPVEKFA